MPTLTLGDFELGIFSDGTYPLDGGAFFGVIPKLMWSRKAAADDKNYVQAGLNSLVIRADHPRTGKQTILVETGMGNKLSERMVKFYGQPAQLLTNLAAAGISPEDIDIVINTHLHFDHCGWNTVRNAAGKIVPTFPRAKYYAPEGEWQYARHPSERDSISYISDNYDPLVASGQMTLLKGGEGIVPGISVKTFPGHTASMMGVIIKGCHPEEPSFGDEGPERAARTPSARREEKNSAPSAQPTSTRHEHLSYASGANPISTRDPHPQTACYIGDLIPTTAHIDIAWGMGFDLYPLQTIESKKEYYSHSVPEKWLTVFTHDPKTPWAYIERDETGKMLARAV